MRPAVAAALLAIAGVHVPFTTEPPPTFTRRPDGTVTVDRWTRRVEVSHEFLLYEDNTIVRRDAGLLRFTVANGYAVYAILNETADFVQAELISGEVKAA